MLLGSLLLSVFIMILLTQYPFYLRKYKPKKYVGIWYTFGEINKTPINALMYPLVYLIGGLIYIFLIQ